MKKQPILQVDNIKKSFGGLNILKDISFDVNKGERIGIIGPNGAGKTTFFNLLTGDLTPTEGGFFIKEKILLESRISSEPAEVLFVPFRKITFSMTFLY